MEANSERWQGGMMNSHPIEDLALSLPSRPSISSGPSAGADEAHRGSRGIQADGSFRRWAWRVSELGRSVRGNLGARVFGP